MCRRRAKVDTTAGCDPSRLDGCDAAWHGGVSSGNWVMGSIEVERTICPFVLHRYLRETAMVIDCLIVLVPLLLLKAVIMASKCALLWVLRRVFCADSLDCLRYIQYVALRPQVRDPLRNYDASGTRQMSRCQ